MKKVVFLVVYLSLSCNFLLRSELQATVAASFNIFADAKLLQEIPPQQFAFGYNLDTPDTTFKLADNLDEISGLSAPVNSSFLYAVQDEDGVVYAIDKKTGNIQQETKFHKDGDYEGIEFIGTTAYVIKSTGTIFEIENFGQPTQQTNKYNSFLSKDNDVEGLGYDQHNNRLLLACKGIDSKHEKTTKKIYAFNLSTKELDTLPVFTISLEDVQRYLIASRSNKELGKFVNFFDENSGELFFSPSAIAVHPLTNDIYISSSVGKLIMVLNEQGEIMYIEKLKKKIHPQPEGLAFDSDGTLYISNEGKDGKARLHRFGYKK